MNLTTLSENLRIARNEANEDTSLLDLTTAGDYANRPAVLGTTGVGVIDIMRPDGTEEEVTNQLPLGAIEFSFTGGSAAGKTFGWRVLSWRSKGPARLVAVGTGTLGTQAVVTYPTVPGFNATEPVTATNKFWADTLVVTWENWPKRVEPTDTTGHNTVASIWMDCCARRYWKIEITDADGSTGTEAGNIAGWWEFW